MRMWNTVPAVISDTPETYRPAKQLFPGKEALWQGKTIYSNKKLPLKKLRNSNWNPSKEKRP